MKEINNISLKLPLFNKSDKLNSCLNILLLLSLVWLFFNLLYVYVLKLAVYNRVETASLIFAVIIIAKLFYSIKDSKEIDLITNTSFLSARQKLFLSLLIIVIWFAIYLPYLHAPFLSDDYVFLKKFSSLSETLKPWEFFRPFFGFVFFIMIKLFGYNPIPFHMLSFLLHISSSAMLYMIAKRIFIKFEISFLIAVLFFMSPLQVEAVAWISCLQELIWTFFILWAFYIYIRDDQLRIKTVIYTIMLIIPALFTKETATCFILLFLLADLVLFKFKRGKFQYVAYFCFITVLLLYLFIRISSVSIPSEHLKIPGFYFIKSFLILPVRKYIFPWNESYLGELILLKFVAGSAIVLLFLFSFLKKRISPLFFLSIGIIYIPLIPLLTRFFIAGDLQGSRFLYLSSFGWAIMLSILIHQLMKNRLSYITALLIITILMSVILYLNLQPWHKAGEIVSTVQLNLPEERVPDNYHGAYIFRNGYEEYKLIKSRAEKNK